MKEGITITEACANNTIGTKEDFERSCNPDGTVKNQSKTTTISLKNSDSSITVNTAALQIGGAALVVLTIMLVVILIKKLKRKNK